MQIEYGNAKSVETEGTGWFIGFSDWTKCKGFDLRNVPESVDLRSICVKWYEHQKGNPNGEAKPISEGRNISILVSQTGKFQIDFSNTPDFSISETNSFVLREHGDFVIWGTGIYHRSYGLENSSILTIRWKLRI